jgi:hypothetical protein
VMYDKGVDSSVASSKEHIAEMTSDNSM